VGTSSSRNRKTLHDVLHGKLLTQDIPWRKRVGGRTKCFINISRRKWVVKELDSNPILNSIPILELFLEAIIRVAKCRASLVLVNECRKIEFRGDLYNNVTYVSDQESLGNIQEWHLALSGINIFLSFSGKCWLLPSTQVRCLQTESPGLVSFSLLLSTRVMQECNVIVKHLWPERTMWILESKEFWRVCITLRITGFVEFVRSPWVTPPHSWRRKQTQLPKRYVL
jgi:hypothetical protein